MKSPKPKPKRSLILIIAGGALVLCMVCGLIGALANKGKATPTPAAVAAAVDTAQPVASEPTEPPAAAEATELPATSEPTEAPAATKPPADTATPKPTATPAPTDTPEPTPVPTEPAKPITLSGSGQTATDAVSLPYPLSVARLTHNGSRNFIVTAWMGEAQNLLVNTIGSYDGARPLFSNEPVIFDIKADGAWTITIEPIGTGGQPAFSGRGDAVSPLFDPPAAGAWLFKHDGTRNFAVWLYCAGGQDLVQNEIGAVDGSGMVRFSKGPCCWDVQADGNWSLTPK